MKSIINQLILSVSIFSVIAPMQTIHANSYPLSPESKRFITIAAAVGGTIGAAIGGIMYAENSKDMPSKPGYWEKFKEFARFSGYILIPAAIGATIAGGGSYFFTWEKLESSWTNDLIAKENDTTFKLATNDQISELNDVKKNFYFSGKYKSHALYEKLNSLHQSLMNLKKNFVGLLQSGIAPLADISKRSIDRIDGYLASIQNWLQKLNNDPQYLTEKANKLSEELAQVKFERNMAQANAAAQAALNAVQQQQRYAYHTPPATYVAFGPKPFPVHTIVFNT